VRRTGEDACELAVSSTDPQIIGIAEGGAPAGAGASITLAGLARARVGVMLTPGVHRLLSIDGEGRVVPAVVGDYVVAAVMGFKEAPVGSIAEILLITPIILGISESGAGGVETLVVTLGAEVADARLVTIQALDEAGDPVASKRDIGVRLGVAYGAPAAAIDADLSHSGNAADGVELSNGQIGAHFETTAAGLLKFTVQEKNMIGAAFWLEINHLDGGEDQIVEIVFA
jgi:hypothetical protein